MPIVVGIVYFWLGRTQFPWALPCGETVTARLCYHLACLLVFEPATKCRDYEPWLVTNIKTPTRGVQILVGAHGFEP